MVNKQLYSFLITSICVLFWVTVSKGNETPSKFSNESLIVSAKSGNNVHKVHISGSITPSPDKKKKEKKSTDKKNRLIKGEILDLKNIKISGEEQSVPKTLENGSAKFVVFNFEQADILDVIVTISDLLKINYIIDPGVKGVITIHTSEKIPVSEAYAVFEQILALNGVSLVKKGKLYKFIPSNQVLREPIETYIGRDNKLIPMVEKLIFQIIPINYFPVSTLKGILKPLLTKNGFFLDLFGQNRLFLVESASNIKRLIDIINALDVNMFDKIQVKLFDIKYANSSKLVKEIEKIFVSMGYGKGKQLLNFIDLPRLKSILVINAFPKIFPAIDYWINKLDISLNNVEVKLYPVKYLEVDELEDLANELKMVFSALGYAGVDHVIDFQTISRLNSLLVINSYPDLFPVIKEWLDKLDQPAAGQNRTKIYVYYVQHSEAGSIASLLNLLFLQKSDNKNIKIKVTEKTNSKTKKEERIKKVSGGEVLAGSSKGITLSGDLQGEINIIADEITNALIIRTNPGNYPILLDTIKKLDIMPMQVLIEVIVVELQLDDSTRYGLEWALKGGGGTQFGGSFSSVGKFPNPSKISLGEAGIQGLGFFVHKSEELLGLLQAFSRDSKLEVLSSPLLLTSENQPASINIVNQIPIETKTVDPSTNVTSITIQYKEVGIKLNVLPKINKEKYISLDLSQEVSQVSDIPTALTAPAIFSRKTHTNVVVKDRQTLVIAGLMEKRKSNSKTGLPGLLRLPFMGCLFGSKSETDQKTELLIFITPHVITDTEEANKLTDDFRKQLKSLNFELEGRQ